MFPITDAVPSSARSPVNFLLSRFFVRGCIYTVDFFFVEFISGALLRCFHMCPWDYSNTPLNYRGLIRPDYASPLGSEPDFFLRKYLENSLEKST